MRTQSRTTGGQEWAAQLKIMGLRVDAATRHATTEAGHAVERSVKRYLRTYTHPPGTPTPAPPGGPPALVSGDLMRSVRQDRTIRRRRGVYATKVGPTRTAPYLRIQELGGRAGRNHAATLPARPYQKPRTRAELATIHSTYARHWREALKT